MIPQLSLRDGLLALAVVFVWGTNFVVIRLGLDVLPPLFFATLRFFFVLLPAGLFGLLFIAMIGRTPPGLASLVVLMQVSFTIGLSQWRAPARGARWRTD